MIFYGHNHKNQIFNNSRTPSLPDRLHHGAVHLYRGAAELFDTDAECSICGAGMTVGVWCIFTYAASHRRSLIGILSLDTMRFFRKCKATKKWGFQQSRYHHAIFTAELSQMACCPKTIRVLNANMQQRGKPATIFV